jgi:hypothetical protein
MPKLTLDEKTAGYGLGSICLLIALAMFWGWQMDSALRSQLERSGKRAQASVIAARSGRVSTGKASSAEEYILSVFYLVDLKGVSKDFRVTHKGYTDHPQGSKVGVIYNPQNPEQSILAEDFALDSASSAWIGGAIFAVIAIGLFWFAIRKAPKATLAGA